MLEELFADPLYADHAVYYFRHFTSYIVAEETIYQAHAAAHAAHLQGAFWPMHDILFENQDEL